MMLSLRRRLVLASCTGLFLAACGDSESLPAAPRVAAPEALRGVELVPLEQRAPFAQEGSSVRVPIPDALSPWSMLKGAADLATDPNGTRKLVLARRDGGRRLAIPGPFSPESFTRLVLHLRAPQGARVIAGLDRGAGESLASELVHVPPARETQRVEIAFRGLRAQRADFERIVLDLPGDEVVALVEGIELLDQPLLAAFDEATRESQPIDVGGDLRHGLALIPGAPVGARVRPVPGAELRFSFGMPARPRLPEGGRFELSMELRGGDAELNESYTIDVDATRLGWESVRVPMDPFVGVDTQVSFRLEAPVGADALLALAEVRLVVPAEEPATVLLITSDTHRADHVGVAGAGVPALTPALDALAARGVWFEDCFSSANVTNPSHVALMTGTHPRDTGVFDNKTLLASEAPTLADRFRAAGYRTFASISVRHLGHPTSGLGHGFDRSAHPRGEYSADESVRRIEGWLSEAADESVFIWLHVFDAHWPYAPPEADLARHWPAERDAFDPEAPPLAVPYEVLPGSLQGLKDLDYPRALYRAEVTALDRSLARLFDAPRVQAGVVGVTADHGEVLAEHGIYFGHAGLYVDTLHVPMILAWPGGPLGARVATPARQIDLGRTLLNLAGLEGVEFPGRDLARAIEAPDAPSDARYAIAASRTAASITVGGWHLVLHLRDEEPMGASVTYDAHQVELFDLSRDPACRSDLVESERERARRLRDRLVAWLVDAEPRGWVAGVSADPVLAAHLAALGYTDDGGGEVDEVLEPDCGCAWCTLLR